jgi:RimJ/RimL family protein N-acetyltransferase
MRDLRQPLDHITSHILLRVIVEYHHFTPFPQLRREERVTKFTPDPPPPHARRRPYMHSAKEDKRQDHRGHQSMSGLSDDDSANQNECASIG